MLNRIVLCGAICLIALVLVGPSRAAEDGPYPVWWSEKLRLESLEQIEARLEEPFWDNGGYTVSKGRGDARTESTVDNCNTRKRLFEEGYSAEAPEQYFEVYLWAVCDALEKLATAKLADRSFVRNFVFDRNALDLLPAFISGKGSCSFLCRLKRDNKEGITWTQHEDSIFKRYVKGSGSVPVSSVVRSIQVEDDRTATILIENVQELPIEEERTTVWSYWVDRYPLEILAYGDFNEDGLEDMLMRRQGARNVYVLTRDSSDAVFYVINVREHLCPDYTGCR